MLKVALVEDNPLLAKTVSDKLNLFNSELSLKFHAINGKDFIQKLAVNPRIDVVLMDIQMPEMDGIETTLWLSKNHPNIKIIMLTVFDDDEHIFNAIKAGANGYLLKDETPSVLYNGLVEILNGGAPMSSSIALKALRLLRNPLETDKSDIQIDTPLSTRETEVLEQLAKGLDYKQIAENLIISPATVRKHIENIYSKLKVHNKTEAIDIAKKQRIID